MLATLAQKVNLPLAGFRIFSNFLKWKFVFLKSKFQELQHQKWCTKYSRVCGAGGRDVLWHWFWNSTTWSMSLFTIDFIFWEAFPSPKRAEAGCRSDSNSGTFPSGVLSDFEWNVITSFERFCMNFFVFLQKNRIWVTFSPEFSKRIDILAAMGNRRKASIAERKGLTKLRHLIPFCYVFLAFSLP